MDFKGVDTKQEVVQEGLQYLSATIRIEDGQETDVGGKSPKDKIAVNNKEETRAYEMGVNVKQVEQKEIRYVERVHQVKEKSNIEQGKTHEV